MNFNGFEDLNITHSGKDAAAIKIYYYGQKLPDGQIGKKQGNLKIEMYLMSYYTWDTFFEGYVEDLNGLIFILNSIGIPFEV